MIDASGVGVGRQLWMRVRDRERSTKQNNVQIIKCPALVVCKSLNFRSSKSDFSPTAYSSLENLMNSLNNIQMMPL